MNEKVGLCSYPKSGNTWVRFLLANIINPTSKVDYGNINNLIPTGLPNVTPSHTLEGLCLYKTHLPLTQALEIYDKIIYIARNGFDALESYRWFLFKQHPNLFQNDTDFIISHHKFYGFWGDHYDETLINTDRVHLLKYENLNRNPLDEILSVIDFLGLERERYSQLCSEAILKSSKDNMRGMTGSAKFMKAASSSTNFVRRGESGKGRKYWNDSGYLGNIVSQSNFKESMFNLYNECIKEAPPAKEIPILAIIKFTKRNFIRKLYKIKFVARHFLNKNAEY